MQSKVWKIGTRGSPLALAQAHEVRDRLAAATGLAADRFEIVVIKTSGDRIQDRPLADVGGKGLFTKEIEEALDDGRIDLAVHSSKDMPTVLPEGLVLAAFLPREDVRDAFISPRAATLADLPEGAVVGSASLRRQAMIRRLRPDLKVITFRGSVQTRLDKLARGEVDATLLAYAGLKRLGMEGHVTALLDVAEFLPAVGQGAIGVEIRQADAETAALVALIHDPDTADCLDAERAFLKELDGSCRTPIAGLARIEGDSLHLDGLVLTPDGSDDQAIEADGPRADAERIGREAGIRLRAIIGPDFLTTAS